MNFHYPYKHYIVGWGVAYLIFSYGFWMIIDVVEQFHRNYISIPIYIVCMLAITYYYYRRFMYYRKLSITLFVDKLIIRFDNDEYVYKLSDLKSIIFAKHMQRMKVHYVIHIFGEDGHYFYFTNEILRFKKLNKLLEELYDSKYYKTDKLIKGINDVTEEFLFKYIDWRNINKEKSM